MSPLLSHSVWKLMIVPISIVVIAFTSLALFISPDVADLFSRCAGRTPPFPDVARFPFIGNVCCALSAFFAAAIATAFGKVFLSIFLAFVSSLITTTLVESYRIEVPPNTLVRYPMIAWVFLQVLSGAIVTPLIMMPASFCHSKSYLHHRSTLLAVPSDTPLIRKSSRQGTLPSSALLSIPVSIILGFVLPSVILIFQFSPAAAIVWQFFPVYIAILVRAPPFLPKWTLLSPPTTVEASRLLIFAIPIMMSFISHISLLGLFTFSSHSDSSLDNPLTDSVLHVLMVNFASIYSTVLYWLCVEGGPYTAYVALKWTLLGGPGAGICIAWNSRDDALKDHKTRILTTGLSQS